MKIRNNGFLRGEERNAGILMHITSLPGNFSIGDLGPEARKFAGFLKRSEQRYWQLLPLNPISEASGYSPYSSDSAFAGNTLLISPEDLYELGLIDEKLLRSGKISPKEKVDFQHAGDFKRKMLDAAFETFNNSKVQGKKDFKRFIDREKDWLDDYALYVTIKKHCRSLPWYEWPSEYLNRVPAALRDFRREHEREIEQVMWEQFIFFSQWHALRTYCNAEGVHLYGDLPFYVNYDSADVWSYRDIFSLDNKGKMKFVAGVPPDYFNADGQLWGMPVFRWDILKKQKYSWWERRIKKNMELFDILRLDHFRAFAAYWAVPASEKTARRGKWIKGPGADFFRTLRKRLGELAFVAEDLGDIDESVHALRNEFNLPGMKVLQFAFGSDFPGSDYIPHRYDENFFVYTGTHDNNTVRGWYRKDAGAIERKNLNTYAGAPITQDNVAAFLIRTAYASVAKTAIIPMQDLVRQDERARMNSPATVGNNWMWRIFPQRISTSKERWLREQTRIFERNREQPQH